MFRSLFFVPGFGAPTTIFHQLCRETRFWTERALKLFFSWFNMLEYVGSIKFCAIWKRMKGQDLTDLQSEPWVLSWDRQTHSCLPPVKYGVTTLQNSFFPPEMMIISKPISADDLALFGDEVSWRWGKSDQLFISFGDIIWRESSWRLSVNATWCSLPYYERCQVNWFKAWGNTILSGVAWVVGSA